MCITSIYYRSNQDTKIQDFLRFFMIFYFFHAGLFRPIVGYNILYRTNRVLSGRIVHILCRATHFSLSSFFEVCSRAEEVYLHTVEREAKSLITSMHIWRTRLNKLLRSVSFHNVHHWGIMECMHRCCLLYSVFVVIL